jgi:hypothetical protein
MYVFYLFLNKIYVFDLFENQMYVFYLFFNKIYAFYLFKNLLGICGWANPPLKNPLMTYSVVDEAHRSLGWVTKVTFPQNPPYPITWVHTHIPTHTGYIAYIPTYHFGGEFF